MNGVTRDDDRKYRLTNSDEVDRREDAATGGTSSEAARKKERDASAPPAHEETQERILAILPDAKASLSPDAYLNPALTGAGEKKPPTTNLGPEMTPVRELKSREAVDAAMARERFFAETLAPFASKDEALAHADYREELQRLRTFGTPDRIAQLRIADERRVHGAETELAALGDTHGRLAGETNDHVLARRDELRATHDLARIEAESSQLTMDEDGMSGGAEHLARRRMADFVDAMNPGTTVGQIYATMSLLHGDPVEQIRAAGQGGSALEGLASAGERIHKEQEKSNLDLTERGSFTRTYEDNQRARGRSRLETGSVTNFFEAANVDPRQWSAISRGLDQGSHAERTPEAEAVERHYGGEAQARGRWTTPDHVESPIEDLALDEAHNSATHVADWIIPKDTLVLRGPAAPLNGHAGGAQQIFVADPSVLEAPKSKGGAEKP